MGAWSMPSLSSAKPLAPFIPKATTTCETPLNKLSQQVQVEPQKLCANQLCQRHSGNSFIAMQLTNSKGHSRQPCPLWRWTAALGLPHPPGPRRNEQSAQLHTIFNGDSNNRPTTALMQGASSCPEPRTSLQGPDWG